MILDSTFRRNLPNLQGLQNFWHYKSQSCNERHAAYSKERKCIQTFHDISQFCRVKWRLLHRLGLRKRLFISFSKRLVSSHLSLLISHLIGNYAFECQHAWTVAQYELHNSIIATTHHTLYGNCMSLQLAIANPSHLTPQYETRH